MTDGQVLMLLVGGFVLLAWVGLVAFETWLDVRYLRRDPVIADLRARLNDNERPELDAQPLVSTDPAKETT